MKRILIAADNFLSDALKRGIAKTIYFSLLQRVTDSADIPLSVREVARDVGVDEKTIRNHLNTFCKIGLISAPKSAESPQKVRRITLYGVEVLQDNKRIRKSAPKSAESPQPLPIKIATMQYVSDEMKRTWSEWLAYRKSIKKPFASERQEQIAYGKLMREANNDYQNAKAIIEQSIANGWQGLFPLKYATAKPINTTDNYASRAESRRRMSSLATEIVSRDADIILGLYDGQERQSNHSVDKK